MSLLPAKYLDVWCCGCGETTDAALCSGTDIYPLRPDLAAKRFWQCLACGNYVGCHPGGDKPLGNIPTPKLRKARSHIHAILDPLWKTKRMSRRAIYGRISEHIGRPYHTGEIKTVDEARDIYRFVRMMAQQQTQGE
jgi:hypothetical protein